MAYEKTAVKPRWRPMTSNSSEDRKRLLYHFSQLNSVFSNGPYLYQVISVHKTIMVFFKSISKYEISAHFLPRWPNLKLLLDVDVSSTPFLLFLSARLTRSWLHYIWFEQEQHTGIFKVMRVVFAKRSFTI
jgi:hypothetical protein